MLQPARTPDALILDKGDVIPAKGGSIMPFRLVRRVKANPLLPERLNQGRRRRVMVR